jgi:hypothetical protein
MEIERPNAAGRQQEHHRQSNQARNDAGEHETAQVLAYRERRWEDVQEIARPHVFEKRYGHPLHDPGEEIPEQYGPKKHRDEIETAQCHGIEIPGDESPEHHIDRYPYEQGQNTGGASTHEIKLAQNDGQDLVKGHQRSSNASGSRAMLLQYSQCLIDE